MDPRSLSDPLMIVYFSLFEEKPSEPPVNANPLHSPRLDPNAPPRDRLGMALSFSVFHFSVLEGLGRTPRCFITQSGLLSGSAPVLCLLGPRRLLGLSQPGRPCPVSGFGQSISSSGRVIILDNRTDNICTYIDSWCQTRSPSGRHTPVCLGGAWPHASNRNGRSQQRVPLRTVLGDGNDIKETPREWEKCHGNPQTCLLPHVLA